MNYMKEISVASFLMLAGASYAADPEYTLTIREHRFSPAELRIPAGQKIRLVVDNQDGSAEEFESHELNREKIVAAKSKVVIYVGPLRAGRYPFFGDFNPAVTRGVLIAE
jgi:hypothetical protein